MVKKFELEQMEKGSFSFMSNLDSPQYMNSEIQLTSLEY